MYNPSEVYTLSSGRFPDHLHQADLADGPVYQAQLMFTGPDAAIEVTGSEITSFMNGVPSDNPHFRDLIESYKESIKACAEVLRKASGDRVVFTGVWYHLDYKEEPRFEPYVTHIISAEGAVSSRRYDLEMFDYDSPGEGLVGMLALETTVTSTICQVLKSEAVKLARIKTISPETCGLKPLQGVIWFPAEEGEDDDLPVIVSKLFAVKGSDQPPEYDVAVFPKGVLTPSQCEFTDALAEATDTGNVTPRLLAAYDGVAEDHGLNADKTWVLRELSQSKFGIYRGELVLRGPRPGPMTLSELANSSTARGAWFQVRFGDNVYGPRFADFDDDDRIGRNDDRGALIDRRNIQRTDDFNGCLLVSDWYQSKSTHSLRYLALGSEPRLSW